MSTFIITVLATLGVTFIVTKSYLFEAVREYPEGEFFATLLHCPQCFSVWAGIVVGLCSLLFVNLTILQSILYIAAVAFVSSLFAEIIEKVIYE